MPFALAVGLRPMTTTALVILIVLYLAGLLWLVARGDRKPARQPRQPLRFIEPPRRGVFRLAGMWHCTKCGKQLADGEGHFESGAWTCPTVVTVRRAITFKEPAAKGFNRMRNA